MASPVETLKETEIELKDKIAEIKGLQAEC